MDLETLNKEYLKFKSDLETAKNEIESLGNRANDLADDKIIWKEKLTESKKNKDDVAKKQAEDKIKKIDSDIKVVQYETVKKKSEIEQIQTKINDKIKEIKENPEMKKHLDEVLAKKYSRKISDLEDKREKATGKRDRLTNLKQLTNDHPALGNNLKGVLIASKEIRDLQAELEKIQNTINIKGQDHNLYNRKIQIKDVLLPQAIDKLLKNKKPLMDYIPKHNLNIKEQDINELARIDFKIDEKRNIEKLKIQDNDELARKDFKIDEKGNIDLNTIMDKDISVLNKRIKGYDKSIRNHQVALENVNLRRGIVKQAEQTQPEQVQPEQQPVEQEPVNNEEPPKEQPKWYQFIQNLKIVKKFKEWNEKRKQKALPEPQHEEPIPVPTPDTPETETSETSNERNEFLNSLKYEIVQDVAKEMVANDLKEAKKQKKTDDMER